MPGVAEALGSGASFTLETEVFFPKREIVDDKNYTLFPSTTSSIMGMHACLADNTNIIYAADDTINFNIVALKPDHDKRNVKFGLITSGSGNIITDLFSADTFTGVYDNEKWNLAFRLRPTKYPLADLVDESLDEADTAYTYELYGVNYVSNVLQNEFTVSGTMSLTNATKFFTSNKRVFLGAARHQFLSDVLEYSDVKVSSTRLWGSYLDNETIRAHAKNANSFGTLNPSRNSNFAVSNDQLLDIYIPQIDTLFFHWSLDNVTGSDAGGHLTIPDASSGSAADVASKRYGSYSDISKRSYPGRGDFFTSATGYRDQAVDVEFVQTAKQKLPEVVNSDDMVKILNKQDDVVFTRDTTYVQHLLSVEKSMYQIVSEEMLKFFATVADFNNLVGEPVNRYRSHYKRMEKLRSIFFERVENEPDLEKFIEYFKWVDDAVTIMIGQLIPVSSNTVDLLRNMIESHILERSKYWNKFPTMEANVPEPINTMYAIEELKYNWRVGHAPITPAGAPPGQNTNQNVNCLWWKERAERSGVLASGNDNVDDNKDIILKTTITEISGATPTLKSSDGVAYKGSYYPNRSMRRTIDLQTQRSLKIKGGSNPPQEKKHDFYKNIIKWASDDDFIYIDFDNEVEEVDCDDKFIPDEINKKNIKMTVLSMPGHETTNSDTLGSGHNDLLPTDGKASLLLPFSLYSSSVDTGYQTFLNDYGYNIGFNNLHDDKYGRDMEIPMQGPFTEMYVGGMQHRHISLNHYNTDGDGSYNNLHHGAMRPEGWHIQTDLSSATVPQQIYLIQELFDKAPILVPSNDPKVLDPSTVGTTDGDPSPHEYWINGVGADNGWSFVSGPTPGTPNTGPLTGHNIPGYAFCYVTPLNTQQTFSIVTPLIDLLHVPANDSNTNIYMHFHYHMFGWDMGHMKLQASLDPDFETGVTDLTVRWSTLGDINSSDSEAITISGFQHDATDDPWSAAAIPPAQLAPYKGKRFYIRFFYTAGINQTGHCAIDDIGFYYEELAGSLKKNSFKLLDPTFDNHHRPSAIRTRAELAKRPVNIGNIHHTTSGGTFGGRTQVGNYLNEYEYINTMNQDANDPWFTKHNSKISQLTANILPGKYGASDIIDIAYVGGAGTHIKDTTIDRHGVEVEILTDNITNLDDKSIYVGFDNIGTFQKRYKFVTDAALGDTGDGTPAYNIIQIHGKSTAAEIAEELKKGIEHQYGGHKKMVAVERHGAILSLRQKRVEKAGFELINRNYLATASADIDRNIKNKTRFKSRFSSPGGFEVMSRGFLDPAHEIYSAYNAMPWKNNWGRTVYNTQLQAHMGQFGVSTHIDHSSFANAVISFVSNPLNGETMVLKDAKGTTVTIKVNTANSTVDGSLHSDGTSHNFGTLNAKVNPIGAFADLDDRLATLINNILYLNITAASHPGTSPSIVTLTQDNAGSYGNTKIISNFSNIGFSDFGSSTSPGYTAGLSRTARVYGDETPGVINALDYTITGDASKHKYHRNNIGRISLSGSSFKNEKSAQFNGYDSYFEVEDDDSLSFGVPILGGAVASSNITVDAWGEEEYPQKATAIFYALKEWPASVIGAKAKINLTIPVWDFATPGHAAATPDGTIGPGPFRIPATWPKLDYETAYPSEMHNMGFYIKDWKGQKIKVLLDHSKGPELSAYVPGIGALESVIVLGIDVDFTVFEQPGAITIASKLVELINESGEVDIIASGPTPDGAGYEHNEQTIVLTQGAVGTAGNGNVLLDYTTGAVSPEFESVAILTFMTQWWGTPDAPLLSPKFIDGVDALSDGLANLEDEFFELRNLDGHRAKFTFNRGHAGLSYAYEVPDYEVVAEIGIDDTVAYTQGGSGPPSPYQIIEQIKTAIDYVSTHDITPNDDATNFLNVETSSPVVSEGYTSDTAEPGDPGSSHPINVPLTITITQSKYGDYHDIVGVAPAQDSTINVGVGGLFITHEPAGVVRLHQVGDPGIGPYGSYTNFLSAGLPIATHKKPSFTGGITPDLHPELDSSTYFWLNLDPSSPASPIPLSNNTSVKFTFDINSNSNSYLPKTESGRPYYEYTIGLLGDPSANPSNFVHAVRDAVNDATSEGLFDITASGMGNLTGDEDYYFILTQNAYGDAGNTAARTFGSKPFDSPTYFNINNAAEGFVTLFTDGEDGIHQPVQVLTTGQQVGLESEWLDIYDLEGQKVRITFDPTAGNLGHPDTSDIPAVYNSSLPQGFVIGTADIYQPYDILYKIKELFEHDDFELHHAKPKVAFGSISPAGTFGGTENDTSHAITITQEIVGLANSVPDTAPLNPGAVLHVPGNSQDAKEGFGTFDVGINDALPGGFVQMTAYSGGEDPTPAYDKPFSISAWINMTDATNFAIFEKSYFFYDQYEYQFFLHSDDTLRFKIIDYEPPGAAYSNQLIRSNDPLTNYEGQWIHVACTADGETTDKSMKLYINGQELVEGVTATRTNTGTYTNMNNTETPARIGTNWTDGAYFSSGLIDEISLWGAELTAAEILELYNGTNEENIVDLIPGPGDLVYHSKYNDLISWWRLGDTGDTIVNNPGLGDYIAVSMDKKGTNNALGKNTNSYTLPPYPSDGAPGSSMTHVITGSVYDNAFVSHMIPRTDKQYAWITASLI